MSESKEKRILMATASLCMAILCLLLTEGCATGGKADWADLVKAAEPEFELGKCGPQLRWNKTLVVYEKADVEATLVIKPHCKDKPLGAKKLGHSERAESVQP